MKTPVIILILLAGFLSYVNALPNAFIWDDEDQVVKNTFIRDWANLPLAFASSTFHSGGETLAGAFYRPLVTLSYMLNYAVWGLNPAGFRLFQLLVHLANALLVFCLVRRILANRSVQNSSEIAGLSALVFAIHPANVESVAYIGSAGEVLCAFLLLLGLTAFVKGSFIGAFSFIFLGLLAKESAVVALPLLFLYTWLLEAPRRASYTKLIAGSGAVMALYAFLRLVLAQLPPIPGSHAPISESPFVTRLLTVPYELYSYLKILFFPADLSVARHFVVQSASDARFWAALPLVLVITAMCVWYGWKTKSRHFTFFALWFPIALAPVLNIVPLEMTIAERWLYVPMIGVWAVSSMIAVPLLLKLRGRSRSVAYVAVFVVLGLLFARTILRNQNWKDEMSLYGNDIKIASRVSPQGSYELENYYGMAMFRAGRVGEAGEYFRRSIALQPNWMYSRNNLGAALEKQGDFSGALEQYRRSVEAGDYYLAYENIGAVLLQLKRYDEAKEFLSAAIRKFPRNSKLKLELALLYADNTSREPDALRLAREWTSLALQDDPLNEQAQQLRRVLQDQRR